MGGASSPDEAFCDAMTLSYDGANLQVLWIPAGTVDEWEASQSDRREFDPTRGIAPPPRLIRGKAATHCSATLLGNEMGTIHSTALG